MNLSSYACVCVCVCVCMYICMYVCMYVYISAVWRRIIEKNVHLHSIIIHSNIIMT